MNLCLLTPAWGRYTVSDIVFQQRETMLDALQREGIDAWALIVADDENIDIAHQHGHWTLKHPNKPLGAKLNAGFQHALDQGADMVCFIGSDSLALPGCFTRLDPDTPNYGRWYTTIDQPVRQPLRVVSLNVPCPTWALNIYPAHMLQQVAGQPCEPHRNSGLDGSIRQALNYTQETCIDIGPHQVVTIRTHPQITSTDKLIQLYKRSDARLSDLVTDGYPKQTIQRIDDLYAAVREHQANHEPGFPANPTFRLGGGVQLG